MMQKDINLSYIITTFQKLPYLKIVLPELIANRLDDEEIVIIDGGSKDGTAEWLQELHAQNKIQQFVSAKDFGESHGTNRALLTSRGKLVKILTDDDIYNFQAIRECKDFMLAHEDVDMIGADGFDNYTGAEIELIKHTHKFELWKSQKEPFGFYGPGLMVRRSSIALIGIFNCLAKFIDHEFTYRATCLPIKLAWYNKPVFVRVINPESNTLKFLKRLKLENQLNDIYFELARNTSSNRLKQARFINAVKRRVYDVLYKRSSQIKASKYSISDTEQLYQTHRKTLNKAFADFQGTAFSV